MTGLRSLLPGRLSYARWWHAVNAALFAYYRVAYGGRCSVMEEDWDTLVILDACRMDLFEERNEIAGDLTTCISRGTSTGQFLTGNFGDETFFDTVYVTGNPHVSRICEGQFHDIVPVWESGWDDELKTVRPETMVEATFDATEEYPDKRIISHFIQPHAPYIGERTRERIDIQSGITLNRLMATGDVAPDGDGRSEYPNAWSLLRDGEISEDDLWDAYVENLDLVLEAVEPMVDGLDGRTVVTSDHGEMFGEFLLPLPRRKFGHASNVHSPLQVTVPWLVVDGEQRRRIVEEPPETHERDVDEDVEERLAQLGYTES